MCSEMENLSLFKNQLSRMEAFHWVYSSASNYQDKDSVLELEKIVHELVTY